MDPPLVPDATLNGESSSQTSAPSRSQSFSQHSDDSRTAAEFINEQLQLEADAREALPYSIDTCTKPLGPLRQILFACLTCNPAPANPSDPYTPAGVCYSCSVQCHGDHELVELFNKRNFTCDCGTTRLPSTSPCTLRINPASNTKGGAHSETAEPGNKYNQNFRNRFCGCENLYDPFMQKGTMFQCLGLGTADEGGCGEDWWHPGCIAGLGPDWFETTSKDALKKPKADGFLTSIAEVAEAAVTDTRGEAEELQKALETTAENPQTSEEDENGDEDPPMPPGFPHEDDFDGFICYKCVDANPWIKKYAGAPGFLAPVFNRSAAPSPEKDIAQKTETLASTKTFDSKKRKTEDESELDSAKRVKTNELESKAISTETTGTMDKLATSNLPEGSQEYIEPHLNDKAISAGSTDTLDKSAGTSTCKVKAFAPAPSGQFSLFFKSDFRDHLCRCSDCFPNLAKHSQLLEEEENYEPPMSESGDEAGGSTVGSGSIYDRGESALKNVDRVRAIEGVMAYNHLKDKLKPFFQQFAESGKAISADDIKNHFAKMRGDEQAIKDAGQAAKKDNETDHRKEQGGH